jgi:hypothetical protein
MKCLPVFLSLSVILIAIPASSRGDTLVPAGTLLSCTVSEPNLSSKTADVGDPVLCYAAPVAGLGRTLLPYGTYLVGRFEDYRDPGDFVGKGWMELNFDRMVSGPDRVIPISAKVVHVPGLRVDKKGRIIGKGHAVRDTVEWMIPVLWPVKVVTLPMRGPRPTLKTETRMTLKLMDDVLIPSEETARNSLSRSVRPRLAYPPSRYQPGSAPSQPLVPASQAYTTEPLARNAEWTQNTNTVGVTVGTIPAKPQASPAPGAPGSPKSLAMLIRRDGTVEVASDYWLDGSTRLRFVSVDGSPGEMPVEQLDLPMTVATNRRCGVNFTLRTGNPR